MAVAIAEFACQTCFSLASWIQKDKSNQVVFNKEYGFAKQNCQCHSMRKC